MARSQIPRQPRRDVHIGRAATLLLWVIALVGYFGPWVGLRPPSAALGWNAYDLFVLLRVLPEIESRAVTVNLQTLQLPLLCLAALLPAVLGRAHLPVRVGITFVGCGLVAITMPPYPQILTAYRAPGWRVPFWWGLGTIAAMIVVVWAWHSFTHGDRHGIKPWLMIGAVEIAVIPAAITFHRLLPALHTLHAATVSTGWGFWSCILGLSAIAIIEWVKAMNGTKPVEDFEHMHRVKSKYEAALLCKANVVSVGIGLPIRDGKPVPEPGIVVGVTQKVPPEDLALEDLVPSRLEGVRVWVEEVGQPQAQG